MTWRLPWRQAAVKAAVPQVGDPSLVVVASGDDEAVASSVALGEAGFDDPEPVVLRHVLRVPADQRETVVRRCVVEGFELDPTVTPDGSDRGQSVVAVARVSVVDAVSLSRSRSRMASVASRVGGNVESWAVLRRGDAPETAGSA